RVAHPRAGGGREDHAPRGASVAVDRSPAGNAQARHRRHPAGVAGAREGGPGALQGPARPGRGTVDLPGGVRAADDPGRGDARRRSGEDVEKARLESLSLYSSFPNCFRSSGPSFVATFSLPWTETRICSTTSGLASVVMSPVSMVLEIAARTRRMIFPERVFGMSGTMWTFLGRAIFPIIVSIVETTLSTMSLLGAMPGFSAM